MSLRAEILALLFGALLVLVTFGDAYLYPYIGNLDTIFGLEFWKALDVLYPVASIVIFLLYGWVNGNGLRINATTSLLFISFIAALVLVNIDDLVQALNLALKPPKIYWIIIMWVYPIYSAIAFFLFGKIHRQIGIHKIEHRNQL